MDPMISDPDEYAGQMTPTPGALRAYRTPDADPASSVAGVHVKQRAKTGGIVLAVLLGGALFLAFANRERISGVLSESRGAKVESEQTTIAVVPQDLALRIQMADAAWISSSLLKSEESKLSAVATQTIEALEHELGTAGTGASWEHVNLLRMKGQLKDARTMAKELQKGPEQSYALSMLDLAEAEDNPPWPVVIERLRESSTGERGRFLARSAYIYALGASGAVARARADFEALEQVAGAKDAPLFDELKAYLARLGAFEATAEGPTDSGEPSAETTSEETTAETADEDLEDPDATKDTGGEVSEKVKKQPKVSEAIKSQVAQADAMWRGGNQEGALAIYRKVVAEIGTEHFLGQRAAARIAQAAREKAAAQ